MITVRNKKWADIARRLFDVQQQRKSLEYSEKALMQELKKLSKDQSACNKEFIFKKNERAGGVDYASIVSTFKIDTTPFKKAPIVWWKLSENRGV